MFGEEDFLSHSFDVSIEFSKGSEEGDIDVNADLESVLIHLRNLHDCGALTLGVDYNRICGLMTGSNKNESSIYAQKAINYNLFKVTFFFLFFSSERRRLEYCEESPARPRTKFGSHKSRGEKAGP